MKSYGSQKELVKLHYTAQSRLNLFFDFLDLFGDLFWHSGEDRST